MSEDKGPSPVYFRPSPRGEGSVDALRERRRDYTDLAKAALKIKTLEELVYTDDATGLFNRRLFDEKLPALIAEAIVSKAPLALMLFDLDGMKRTNKSEGYQAGDQLIKAGGQAALKIARSKEDDIIGRFGGDEFFAIMPGYKPLPGQDTAALNQSRIDRAEQQFVHEVREIGIPDDLHVGITAGIAVFNPGDIAQEGLTAEDAFQRLFTAAESDLKARKEAKAMELERQGISFYDDRLQA